MMEIKFRAKGKDGKWYYTDPQRPSVFWADIESGFLDINTLGQFSGCHDKYGDEIYAGDILEYMTVGLKENGLVRDEVIFQKGGFRVLRHTDLDLSAGTTHLFVDASVFHRIGNIHDNPELLKC